MRKSITDKLPAVVALMIIILGWYALSESGIVPAYMLPSPVDVARTFVTDMPTLLSHGKVTMQETLYGLGLGILLAFVMATVMDRLTVLDKACYPLIIISQTIPTIAIAPLLVLWMGFGMAPKITLVVITTFFPISIGLLNGYKGADRDALNLLRSMGASELQIFRHVKFPGALPAFFSGLQISASYAVVGAVVAEWLGGFEGLGVYMTRVKKAYAFDKMFAVIIFIVIISLLLLLLVRVIAKISMPWAAPENRYEKERKLK